jgi:glutamate decarboxylase
LIADGSEFPIVAVRAADPHALDLVALSDRLRERGWIVPAYTLPPNAEQTTMLRMVVKENFSRVVDMLAHDLARAIRSSTKDGPRRPRRRPHC